MPEVNNLDTLVAMLKKLPMSRGLDDLQLVRLASSSVAIHLNQGETPLKPEGYDDRFFVVVSGKVRTTFVHGRRPSYSSIARVGDFLGAEKILYGQINLESATAIEPCELIAIASVALAGILRETPTLRQNLKEGREIYHLRQNKHFAWLAENENVDLITRKHRLVLLISLLPPLGVGWLGVFFLWLATLTRSPSFQAISSWIGIGVMGLAVLWALWRIWEWSTDFYIVTDQRVVWQRQITGLYDSRVEIPMSMVMPPKLTQSRYERILGFGDIFLVTDRTPVDFRVYIHIDLLDVPFPDRIQELIEQYRKQAISQVRAEEDAAIESVLLRYLEPPATPGKPALGASPGKPTPSSSPAEAAPKKKPPVHQRIADTFKTRLEDGGMITYRKHWLVLFRKVWLPTLVSLIVLGLLAFLLQQRITHKIHTPSALVLICLGLLIYMIPVVWWIYQVLDWRNDIYQLADDKLLDIERKPFIGNVISRPILLSKIRSLDFDRAGVLGLLLNSGSIYIGTVDDNLTFEGVHEPDRILRELFYRVYILRQKANEAEIRNRQDTTARMVVAYHRRTESGRRLGDASTAQKSG
jgi:hypothetical protein